MPKYEISLIPNYGNEKIIIETVKKMGIKSTGKTRESGFAGCDVPVILDIECDSETKDLLDIRLKEVSSDQCDVYWRCPTCGKIDQ